MNPAFGTPDHKRESKDLDQALQLSALMSSKVVDFALALTL
jgi:hypothetical protein